MRRSVAYIYVQNAALTITHTRGISDHQIGLGATSTLQFSLAVVAPRPSVGSGSSRLRTFQGPLRTMTNVIMVNPNIDLYGIADSKV